jgi:hypothetical protein
MILIQSDIEKTYYTVRLENIQTDVSGFHLSHDMAAEIGFEKMTGKVDVIEKTRFVEKADGWHAFIIEWEASTVTSEFPAVRREKRFARVYVRRIEPPKTGPARSRQSFAPGQAVTGVTARPDSIAGDV